MLQRSSQFLYCQYQSLVESPQVDALLTISCMMTGIDLIPRNLCPVVVNRKFLFKFFFPRNSSIPQLTIQIHKEYRF